MFRLIVSVSFTSRSSRCEKDDASIKTSHTHTHTHIHTHIHTHLHTHIHVLQGDQTCDSSQSSSSSRTQQQDIWPLLSLCVCVCVCVCACGAMSLVTVAMDPGQSVPSERAQTRAASTNQIGPDVGGRWHQSGPQIPANNTRTHTHIHTYTHAHTHTYTHTHTHTHTHIELQPFTDKPQCSLCFVTFSF